MGGFASDGETSTAAQEGIDSATPAKMDGMLMWAELTSDRISAVLGFIQRGTCKSSAMAPAT